MQKIQEIKLYLKRLSQVVATEADADCAEVFSEFSEQIKEKVIELWKEFAACGDLVDKLISSAVGETFTMVDAIKTFLGAYDEIIEYIVDGKDMNEIIQMIDMLSSIMFLLQPAVLDVDLGTNL